MPFKSYREESRKNWGRELSENANINIENVQVGARLRMADALEHIASGFTNWKRRAESAESSLEFCRKRCRRLERSTAALRGVITKLKKGGRSQ